MPRRVLDYPASLGGWHAIVSAGHLLSVAGLTAFFVMIFDSMRQGRPALRNSYGVSRFNTRLAFYTYESIRIEQIQMKGWFISRNSQTTDLILKSNIASRHEHFENSFYSYVLVKPNK